MRRGCSNQLQLSNFVKLKTDSLHSAFRGPPPSSEIRELRRGRGLLAVSSGIDKGDAIEEVKDTSQQGERWQEEKANACTFDKVEGGASLVKRLM